MGVEEEWSVTTKMEEEGSITMGVEEEGPFAEGVGMRLAEVGSLARGVSAGKDENEK